MKRTFWAGVGYSLGLGSSIYLQRRVRRTVERYTPEQVRQDLAVRSRQVVDRARGVVVDLREAAQEGAAAMRREEDLLRDEYIAFADPHRHRPARLHR